MGIIGKETNLLPLPIQLEIGVQRTLACIPIAPDQEVASWRDDSIGRQLPFFRLAQIIREIHLIQHSRDLPAVVQL